MRVAERSEHDVETPEVMPQEFVGLKALHEEDHQLHIPRNQEKMDTIPWEAAVRSVRTRIRRTELKLAGELGWLRYTDRAAKAPGFHERNLHALREMLARFDRYGLQCMFVVQQGCDFHVDLIGAEQVQVTGAHGHGRAGSI